MFTQIIVVGALVVQIGAIAASLRVVTFPSSRQRHLTLLAALVMVGRSGVVLWLLAQDTVDTSSFAFLLGEAAILAASLVVTVAILVLPFQFKDQQAARAALEQTVAQQSAALRSFESTYVRTLDAQPDRICRYRLDGTLTYANRRYCEALGRSRDDVVGQKVFALVPADWHDTIRDAIQQISQTTPTLSSEQHSVTPDGERWEEWTRHAIFDTAGNLVEIQAVGRDITQQRLAERALRESEQRLRRIVEQMPVLIIAMDDAGTIISWSHECERVTGYQAEEMVGNLNGFVFLYPDDAYREELGRRFSELNSSFRAVETTVTCKDDSTRTISWSNISRDHPVPGWDRWAVGIDVTTRVQAEAELQRAHASLEAQVAERTAELRATQTSLERENVNRRRAEIALRQSETQLRTTLDAIDDMVYVIDANLRITLCNQALLTFARESGLETNPLGRTPFEVFAFLPDRMRDDYYRVFETGTTISGEDAFELGPVQWISETRKIPIRDAAGHVTHVLTIMRDITGYTHTAAQLAASEDVTRRLIEQSPYGISLVNIEGIVVEWNAALAQLSSIARAQAVGRCLWDVVLQVMPPEVPREEVSGQMRQQMLDFLQGKTSFSISTTHTIQHADGSRHILGFNYFDNVTFKDPNELGDFSSVIYGNECGYQDV